MQDLSRRSLFGFLGAGLVTALGVTALGTGAAEAQVMVYERAMPGMRVEVVPPGRAGMHWVPGHWVWRRGWVWAPGHYQRRVVRAVPMPLVESVTVRPSPRHYWARGHWTWSDRRGDWVWVRGHWVY